MIKSGRMITIGMLGKICEETPQAFLVDHIGWRQTMT